MRKSFNITCGGKQNSIIMTDDSPSWGTCDTSSFLAISDCYGLGQNTLEKSCCKCITFTIRLQKQPSEVFCNKRCSKKFRKTHMKAPVPEFLF